LFRSPVVSWQDSSCYRSENPSLEVGWGTKNEGGAECVERLGVSTIAIADVLVTTPPTLDVRQIAPTSYRVRCLSCEVELKTGCNRNMAWFGAPRTMCRKAISVELQEVGTNLEGFEFDFGRCFPPPPGGPSQIAQNNYLAERFPSTGYATAKTAGKILPRGCFGAAARFLNY